MAWLDYVLKAKRLLVALWIWQWVDITLHIITHLVTIPHALANAVWWIGIPIIVLFMKPPKARLTIIGCNALYWIFIIWFIVDYSGSLKPVDKAAFYFLVTVSQLLAGFAAYFAGQICASDPNFSTLLHVID